MRGEWIVKQIQKYEDDSGNKIEQLAFIQDDVPTYVYPSTVFNHENNQAAWSASWNYMAIVEIVSGRKFQEVNYPREKFTSHYETRNWDNLDEEQVFFEGSTAYIVVY